MICHLSSFFHNSTYECESGKTCMISTWLKGFDQVFFSPQETTKRDSSYIGLQ